MKRPRPQYSAFAALCARLAMSELVGSSAVRPPRFLVLDEVFGSLDVERRTQLLETLGSLAVALWWARRN